MTRVYIADAKPEERSALRLLLLDLKMEVVGEAADWFTTLAQAPTRRVDMLLIEWDLLPNSPTAALDELRRACPVTLVIILISHLDARQQAAISAGADAFISKGETPERVAEHLRTVAAKISANRKDLKNPAVQTVIAFSNNLEDKTMNKDIFEGK
jgi:DNA-binding NarL/FixJ family response regulator